MGLIRRLRRSRDARAQFVSSHVDKTIAFQLRAIRDQQNLSQEKLADLVGMNQNAISRLESEWYGKPTIRTLKRLASALDVALVVRFVPFSQLVNWVSGTPFVEAGLSTESLAVPSFDSEVTEGNFEEVTVAYNQIVGSAFHGITPGTYMRVAPVENVLTLYGYGAPAETRRNEPETALEFIFPPSRTLYVQQTSSPVDPVNRLIEGRSRYTIPIAGPAASATAANAVLANP
jgi:transcriptional regulator with XRE-family HTH domain